MSSFDDIDSFLQKEIATSPSDTVIVEAKTADKDILSGERTSLDFGEKPPYVSQLASEGDPGNDLDLDFIESLNYDLPVPIKELNAASSLDLDFLADMDAVAPPVPASDANDLEWNNPTTSASADYSDLDFLANGVATPVLISEANGEGRSSPATSASAEFSTWLDAPEATSKSPTPSSSAAIVDLPRSDDMGATEEGGGINDFLDEVFGDSHIGRATASGAASAALTGSKKYEAQLREETSSGFPDISTLRNMVLRGGYLPHVARGATWCILLTGGPCVDDQEAEFWKPQGTPSENIGNRALLEQDCTSAVKHVEGTALSPTDTSQCREDLRDILLLYCMRRNIPYAPLMCDLLAPMMLLPPPIAPLSRALASAALYSMHTDFIPTVTLQVRHALSPSLSFCC